MIRKLCVLFAFIAKQGRNLPQKGLLNQQKKVFNRESFGIKVIYTQFIS